MAFHWKPFLNEYSIVKTDTPTFTESKGSKKNPSCYKNAHYIIKGKF